MDVNSAAGVLFGLALVVLAPYGALGAEGVPPAPGRAGYAVIESWTYPDSAAAARAWLPMEGTAPAGVVTVAGRKVLKLPCNFKGTDFERASWDVDLSADLAMARGVRLRVYCPDPGPVGRFSLYFRSGDGWYASTFAPAAGKWSTVTIRKSETRIEGTPAGWGKIEGLRISCWRSQDVDTALYVADFGAVGGSAPVAVVRADSTAAKGPGEAKAVSQFAGNVSAFLEESGVEWGLLSDRDVTAGRLAKVKVIILPHNSDMPPPAAKAVADWVAAGGRMIAFHYLPGGLREAAGISPGGYMHQKRGGDYASIRFEPDALAGAPGEVRQASWGIIDVKPGEGAKVLAWWHDSMGKRTPHPAVVASDTCIYMSHVLLPDSPYFKRLMLLAMVGRHAPGIWKEAAEAAIANIGRFGPFEGSKEAMNGIRAEAGPVEVLHRGSTRTTTRWPPEVQKPLSDAMVDEAVAGVRLREGKYVSAIDFAHAAQWNLVRAYCLAQKPLAGEFRGVWCHSAFGISGWSWDEAAKFLAECGFTDLFPNMCWAGAAYYDSKLLPVAPEVADRGDQISDCLAACRRHGIKVHVWKVNWNLGGRRAPAEFVEKLRKASRLQVTAGGTEQPWLCPSHPENRKLEVESMIEVARKYRVDGIHFDYIRYPGNQTCFCAGCRGRFESFAGAKVANWPADVARGGPHYARWNDFRREQITAVVRGVAEGVRRMERPVKISAAVFPDWPLHRQEKAQDWKMWCDRGWLDFVCPMDYTSDAAYLERRAAAQRKWAGKVPCYPGLGLSASTPAMKIDGLIEQVKVTRRLGTRGFVVFQYERGKIEFFRRLGLGMTRRGK